MSPSATSLLEPESDPGIGLKTGSQNMVDDVQELLRRHVGDAFATMLQIELIPSDAGLSLQAGALYLAGSIRLAGNVEGVVSFCVTPVLARILAARMLGMPEAEIEIEMLNDVVGELTNMIVGGVKSHLCDTGAACSISIPSVVSGNHFSVNAPRDAERRTLGFQCEGNSLLVELVMRRAA
jgi:CheY-specific phosphatase CheX